MRHVDVHRGSEKRLLATDHFRFFASHKHCRPHHKQLSEQHIFNPDRYENLCTHRMQKLMQTIKNLCDASQVVPDEKPTKKAFLMLVPEPTKCIGTFMPKLRQFDQFDSCFSVSANGCLSPWHLQT